MDQNDRLDPVHESDRIAGSTPPERGAESSNVVGRPAANPAKGDFHEPAETSEQDRQKFTPAEALTEGGSYDGLGVPVVEP